VYEIWALSNAMCSRSDPISKLDRRYRSQELAKSSRRINDILTGKILLIHLSGRISKNVERVTRKEATLSDYMPIGAIVPYHLKWLSTMAQVILWLRSFHLVIQFAVQALSERKSGSQYWSCSTPCQSQQGYRRQQHIQLWDILSMYSRSNSMQALILLIQEPNWY
jgi:hypothetical protein